MEANAEQGFQEKIDLYLDGALNEEELQKFELTLKDTPTLIEEIERLKIARSVVKNYALREKLKSIHHEELGARKEGVFYQNYSNYLLKVAAGVILLIVGVVVYQFVTLNSNMLYFENYAGYSIDISRGDDESINNPIVNNYIKGNYQDVVHIYENKSVDSNQNNFLAGSAYLKLREVNKAISSYNKVITEAEKGGADDYLEDSEYYIGLAYLENKQINEAYWFFSKIYHDSNHLYHDKVSKTFYWKLKALKFRRRIFKR